MTTFKIYFSETNIRRITPKSTPTYSEFIALLGSTYPEYTFKQYSVLYLDQDNDKITVSSELEWEELLSLSESNPLIKIYLEEVKQSMKKIKPIKKNIKKTKVVKKRQAKKQLKKQKIAENEKNIEEKIDTSEKIIENKIDEAFKLFENLNLHDIEIPELNMPKVDDLINCIDEGIKIVEDGIIKGYSEFDQILNDKRFGSFDYNFNEPMQCFFKNLVKDINVNDYLKYFDAPLEKEPEVEIKVEQKNSQVPDLEFSFEDSFETLLPEVKVPEVADSYVFEKVKLDIKNDNLSESLIDLRMKWASQLEELKSLGFLCDDEVLALILEQNSGNISDAVSVLLQNSI